MSNELSLSNEIAELAKKWYDKGKWGKAKIRALVETEKITPEDYEEITGEPYE